MDKQEDKTCGAIRYISPLGACQPGEPRRQGPFFDVFAPLIFQHCLIQLLDLLYPIIFGQSQHYFLSQTFLLLSSCAWALGGWVGLTRGLIEVGGVLLADGATNTSLRRGTEVTWIDSFKHQPHFRVEHFSNLIFLNISSSLIFLVLFLTSFFASQTTCWTLSVGSNFAKAVTPSLNGMRIILELDAEKRQMNWWWI